MFRCELREYLPATDGCSVTATIPAGTPAIKVAVKFRPTEYPSRPKANKQRIKRKVKRFDDPGGAGYEIAKEVLACSSCAEVYEAQKAAQSE